MDLERLEAAANEDPKMLQELVELYFAQATDLMNGLRAAINSGSAKDVDHFAHKLVGASLACGMSAMVLPLRELEKRGKEGQLGDAEALFDQRQPPLGIDTQQSRHLRSPIPKPLNTPDPNTAVRPPLMDFDQLQSACDGDAALMRELMDMYFGQADQIMAGLGPRPLQAGAVGEVESPGP